MQTKNLGYPNLRKSNFLVNDMERYGRADSKSVFRIEISSLLRKLLDFFVPVLPLPRSAWRRFLSRRVCLLSIRWDYNFCLFYTKNIFQKNMSTGTNISFSKTFTFVMSNFEKFQKPGSFPWTSNFPADSLAPMASSLSCRLRDSLGSHFWP